MTDYESNVLHDMEQALEELRNERKRYTISSDDHKKFDELALKVLRGKVLLNQKLKS